MAHLHHRTSMRARESTLTEGSLAPMGTMWSMVIMVARELAKQTQARVAIATIMAMMGNTP